MILPPQSFIPPPTRLRGPAPGSPFTRTFISNPSQTNRPGNQVTAFNPGMSAWSAAFLPRTAQAVPTAGVMRVAVSPAGVVHVAVPTGGVMPVAVPPAGATPVVAPPAGVTRVAAAPRLQWVNDLKKMFHNKQAVVYALNLRTFGSQDKNRDGRISVPLKENGTFLSAIPHLDQLVNLGVNTIHLLPINPVGQTKRLGAGGSLYAPSDYRQLNVEFDTPGNNMNVLQEARAFINACHQRGLHVMVDVPSCASADLTRSRPDLILKDKRGRTLVPTNWIDIVMLKRDDPALREYYDGFFDLMANKVGVDGFRVDVARARTPEFWRHFTAKYPDKAWLAESYTQEDQSPLKNLPRDIPEDLLRAGFDSYYGQFHIFHSMSNAKEYMDYLLSNRAMFQRASKAGGNDKSFIGSFLSHDDPSLMERGGVPMCMLASGLMATQPWTNPYILDGFTTGYTGDFDIFNFVPQHKGHHPEIGLFLKNMLNLRKQYEPILSRGAFIPIPILKGEPNNQVISFARQANGKTLLIVANKDLNARQNAVLSIPGLKPTQALESKVPGYGRPSSFDVKADKLSDNLGPARFHVFEIDTPNLSRQLPTY